MDTGLHAFGWTRQQAIDFLAENTALSLLTIANEVDRYIAWPGQAVACKIGELKIRALRQKAEAELGARFNVRELHDALLRDGSIALDVCAACSGPPFPFSYALHENGEGAGGMRFLSLRPQRGPHQALPEHPANRCQQGHVTLPVAGDRRFKRAGVG